MRPRTAPAALRPGRFRLLAAAQKWGPLMAEAAGPAGLPLAGAAVHHDMAVLHLDDFATVARSSMSCASRTFVDRPLPDEHRDAQASKPYSRT